MHRFLASLPDDTLVILFVVFTNRGNKIRLISARKANKKEQYMSVKTRKEQIEYLKNLKDEDIDYSDAPAVTDFTHWEPNPSLTIKLSDNNSTMPPETRLTITQINP